MPEPRRSSGRLSRQKESGGDLFRGNSPAEEGSDDEDMPGTPPGPPPLHVDDIGKEQPMAASASSASTSQREQEQREEHEPQLEGEGINMPNAPGHGTATSEAQPDNEPMEEAISLAAEDVQFKDADPSAADNRDGLVPQTVDGLPPVEDDSSSTRVVGQTDDEASSSFPKSSASSLQDASSSSAGLLASMPVYLNRSLPSSSKLQIFQYPTYPRARPLPIPNSARERGLTPAMRYRPRAKRIEIELPLDLRPKVYDLDKGEQYGHGAAAGEAIGPGPERTVGSSRGRPEVKREHGAMKGTQGNGPSSRRRLEKTRLESTQMPHQTKYMLGIIREGALHLTSVESMHQLRPSMHYLDNLDVLEHKNRRSAATAEAEDGEAGAEGQQARARPAPRTQSLNVSVRATGEGGGPGPGRSGAKPLEGRDALMAAEREAESEAWVTLDWQGVGGEDNEARGSTGNDQAQKAIDSQLFATDRTRLVCQTRPREFLPV